jgi:hypothetical protein
VSSGDEFSKSKESEMAAIFERLTYKKEKDIRTLANFVQIFCEHKHKDLQKTAFPFMDDRLRRVLEGKELMLCAECSKLLNHGVAKLLLCPHDPKPMCKHCEKHCYAAGYREQIREVMKFSGMYLVKHGRIGLLAHLMF